MPKVSASEAFSQLKKATESRASEPSALATLQRGLAQLGYTKLPKHENTRTQHGTVRIYHYHDSPAGHLVLVAGPSIKTELHLADELARAAAPSGSYIQVTGDQIPAGIAQRLSGAVKAGKADVKAAIAAGEIKTPVEVKPPPAPSYRAGPGWAPRTTGATRMEAGLDARHGTGMTPFRSWEPAAPPPAPAPAPKAARAPRAPRAAPAAAAGGISAADMAMLQQLIAGSVKQAMGKK